MEQECISMKDIRSKFGKSWNVTKRFIKKLQKDGLIDELVSHTSEFFKIRIYFKMMIVVRIYHQKNDGRKERRKEGEWEIYNELNSEIS